MTMTDTEAKALALVNAHAINRRSDLDDALTKELRCALLDAVQSQAAIEARHAAELRELKERFSEAVKKVDNVLASHYYRPEGSIRRTLSPFILPAPDPLVEVFPALANLLQYHETGGHKGDGSDHAFREARAELEAAVRKIGEAGE